MSHIRPGEKAPKRKMAECRKGQHAYGDDQSVGGGIIRRVCRTCGSVSIDLTEAHEPTAPVIRPERLRRGRLRDES